jgi:hypothetical protein
MAKKATPNQLAFLKRMVAGTVLRGYLAPGRETVDATGWYIEHPYSSEDGRTVDSAFKRGWLIHDGGGCYILTVEGRQAAHDL